MPSSPVFLNSCKRMPTSTKLETLVFNQIDSTELKCFNTKAEQKAFCSLLKASLMIKRNSNGPVFLPFTLPLQQFCQWCSDLEVVVNKSAIKICKTQKYLHIFVKGELRLCCYWFDLRGVHLDPCSPHNKP